MPIVPGGQNPISTEVPAGPQVSLGSASVVSDAAAGLGGVIAQAGFGLLQQIKNTEAHDAAFKHGSEDLLWSQKTETELKLNSKDGYVRDRNGDIVIDPVTNLGRTIDQEYRDRANARFEENQQKMPSALAQEIYKKDQGQFFTNKIASLQNDVQIKKFENLTETVNLDVQRTSDVFEATPSRDLHDFYLKGDNLSQRLQAGVGTEQDQNSASEMARKKLSVMAEANVRGLIFDVFNRSRNKEVGYNSKVEARKILSILDGEDAASSLRTKRKLYTLANSLTPDQQTSLRQVLLSITKASAKLDETTYNEFVTNMKKGALIKSSQFKDVGGITGAIQTVGKAGVPFLETGQKSVENILNDQAEVAASGIVGQMDTRAFALMPESVQMAQEKRMIQQIDGYIKNMVPKDSPYAASIGESARALVHDKLKELVQMQAAKNKVDAAAFAVDQDPMTLKKLRDSIDFKKPASLQSKEFARFYQLVQTDVKLKNPGYSADRRVLPKDVAADLIEGLRNPNVTNADKVDSLWGLSQNSPKAYAATMRQLREDGLGYEWEYVSIMPSKRLASEFVSTLSKMKPEDDKNFSDYLAQTGYTKENFTEEVRPNLDKFVAAIRDENPWSPNNAAMQTVLRDFYHRKTAQIMMERGGPSAKASALSASKEAYDALVGNHTHVFEISRGSLTGSEVAQKAYLRLPKTLSDGTVVLPSDEKTIQKWADDSLTSEGMKAIGPDIPKNWPAGIDKDRANEQIWTTARPVRDPKDPDALNISFQGRWDKSRQLLLKNGKVISIPIKDILKNRETPSEGLLHKWMKGENFQHEPPGY